MRIIYIITQADGGGAQKYVLSLARHFGGAIAAGNEASELLEKADSLQLTAYSLSHLKRNINPWQDFLAAWEIRELIKTYKPDIVHLNSSKAGILGSFAAIGLKTKVVFTAHGFIFNEPMSYAKKSFYIALEKVASSYRDFIITVSDADKKTALDNKLISPDKISTVHNGIGQIEFLEKAKAKAMLGIADGKIIIGCTSGFYQTKALDVLVKSVKLIEKSILEKIQFVLLGDGPEFLKLKSLILNLQLHSHITLAGKIENAAAYLRAFDIFVLSSRKEGFPYGLLEAMAAGLPIIATNVGGNREALGDAAIIVEADDSAALATAITQLVNDIALQNQLSQKALARAKLFTLDKMLEETKKVYEKILKQS